MLACAQLLGATPNRAARRGVMPKETLAGQAARLVRDLNTLIVGATLEELRTLSAALTATQAHAGACMLELASERTEGKVPA